MFHLQGKGSLCIWTYQINRDHTSKAVSDNVNSLCFGFDNKVIPYVQAMLLWCTVFLQLCVEEDIIQLSKLTCNFEIILFYHVIYFTCARAI